MKRRFPAYVNPDYNGVRFDPIERCKDVSKESREVVFEYIHMECEALTDEVFTVMDCSGLRPALYEELLGFAEKYPDEQRKYPIVALGSVTLVDGNRRVAYLWQKLNTRIQDCCLSPHSIATLDSRDLCLEWREYGWDQCFRFLAVRK